MSINKPSFISGTVFWRVAAVLIAVQLATSFLSVGFTAWYARDQHQALATVAITARLDALSEEIERRANISDLTLPLFSDELELDLAYRFPDPLLLIDLEGNAVRTFFPSREAFSIELLDTLSTPQVPPILDDDRTFSNIVVDDSDDIVPGGFASAPLFDIGGFPAGILVIQPITQSIALELSASKDAFRRSLRIVFAISLIVALLLGAFITWWLVRPLRSVARTLNEIGQGAYDVRLPYVGNDEMGHLATAINEMAAQVQTSIDALKESDKIRRELVANVGHDLRTPMSAIQGHLEEVERFQKEGNQPDADASVSRARRQVLILGKLVDDLFELSRLESTVPRLHEEPILIAELISDAISSNAKRSHEKEITIQTSVSDELPVLRADGIRLLRVLNNLIENAIRYSPAGSSVSVTARLRGEGIAISVADSGEGIDPAALDQVFQRYYRGSHARTRSNEESEEGSGLGLAISKAIAQAHGGTLEVANQANAGAIFTLYVPVPKA